MDKKEPSFTEYEAKELKKELHTEALITAQLNNEYSKEHG